MKIKMPVVGTRAQVLHGEAERTSGGLTKKNLKVSKVSGEIVSKKKAKSAAKNPWAIATEKARGELGLTGFVAFNVGKDGKALYKKTSEIYKKM